MNVKVTDSGSCRKVLEIEIPAAEVTRERQGLVNEFQKFAHLPGFRAGKAPIQMIEKRFSKQIEEELQRKLIPQFYREAIAKEKLKPVSMPELSDVKLEDKSGLKFKATVDVAPDFDLPNYKGLEVKRRKASVTDDQIEESLTLIREQQADFEEVKDRDLKLGDYAILNYKGVIDGKPIGELAPAAKLLGENHNFWLLMAKDAFVPGFCEQLVGAKMGEKRDVNVEFPEKFFNKDVAGKKAKYEVEIAGIRAKKLPELNDEFAKSIGAETAAKLRDQIRERMEENVKKQSESDEKNQIVEFLLKKVSVELPDSLVQAQTRRNIFDVVRENQMRGIAEEEIKNKKDEIFKHASEGARDHVKATFILGKIADKEGVKVEQAEVEARIQEIADNNKVPLEKLQQELSENGGIDAIHEQLLIGKTLDFLLANAKVIDAPQEKVKK